MFKIADSPGLFTIFQGDDMNKSKCQSGSCYTCSNYEEQERHCALLDIWFTDADAETEGDCEYYTTDASNN